MHLQRLIARYRTLSLNSAQQLLRAHVAAEVGKQDADSSGQNDETDRGGGRT